MLITAPGRNQVRTASSVYLINVDAQRASRSRGETSTALFNDGRPYVLAELPQVVVGEPMRLLVVVDDGLLDHAHQGRPAPMLTTEVVSVARVG